MAAPRKKPANSKRYVGVVDARVPRKRNDDRHYHLDSHFCNAQVAYVREFCAQHDDECVLSYDNKNKVNVGTLAVSRYHQISRFFPTSDMPNYPDLDFPYRPAKIVPSGYMVLTSQRTGDASAEEKVPRVRVRSRSSSPYRRLQRPRTRSYSPQRRSDPLQGKFNVDRFGRLHYSYPHTGPLRVVNRASKFRRRSLAERTVRVRCSNPDLEWALGRKAL